MTEPDYFCPQCGPLRSGDDSPIDEDGCCATCGATTCTWPDLVEHLKDEGYELRRDPMLQLVEGYSKAYAALDETGKRVVDAQLDKAIESQLCRHEGFSHTRNVECPRTYPLDPLTAEDPCEDCGRDQRKHEIDHGDCGVCYQPRCYCQELECPKCHVWQRRHPPDGPRPPKPLRRRTKNFRRQSRRTCRDWIRTKAERTPPRFRRSRCRLASASLVGLASASAAEMATGPRLAHASRAP